MALEKSRANRWVGAAILCVLGIFGLVLLLQLAAMLFGPSKSACTKQVCLAKFLEGPPAFNNEAMVNHLKKNFFTPPAAGDYNLSGFSSTEESFHEVIRYIKDYFKNKKNGIFVDLGAGDGEYNSISLELERSLGWTGLLVEPNEELYKRLLKKGRKATSAKICVSPFSYPVKLKLSYPAKDMSTELQIVQALGKTKLDQLAEKEESVEYKVFETQCVPLENLVYAADIRSSIDLLILDMAGSDLDVLISTKLEQIPEFEMIVIRAGGSDIGSELGGYFLERNMVVKKVFGRSPVDGIFVLIKFDARRDL
ncbi:protein Star-like [Macrobrachium rosenbergii]|uniref:protein Star-like n=1 Tax=Macrobrachium rosenbergii TaxID=79674 RepID=UPI0034D788E2